MSERRRLFGPSREEVWKQLAAEIGATYTEGSLWSGDRVRARVDEWTITLDSETTLVGSVPISYTRLRAPYVNADGFRFTLYRKGLFSGLGKLLGMQDIEVGEPLFDEHFIIKGNDQAKVRALFANPRIRELIEAQPSIHLEVKDDEGRFGADFPEGVDELSFHADGEIRDLERLRALYDLFAELLHQLCHIGSAYEDDPKLLL